MHLFWIQFKTLTWKNWIVLSKSPFVSILRCLLLPVAYGVFLSFAATLLHRLNNFGIGTPTPINALADRFQGTNVLYWADGRSSNSSSPSPGDIIGKLTADFTDEQIAKVRMVDDPMSIPLLCPQNFHGLSNCYAGIIFNDLNSSVALAGVNYTIIADAGLSAIDVMNHESDVETRILPLQWAIDKAIIELDTGISQLTPSEWPYAIETNAQQWTLIRLSYTRGIREIIALAFFLTFAGIAYQIPGSVASERALLITEHMKAMGLLDSARILSWHFSVSVTYIPAWVTVALLWHHFIFVETSAVLIVFVHLFLGLSLGSWSFFVAVPFKQSPQLAAVVSSFLGILLAIMGLLVETSSPSLTVFLSMIFPPSFYIFALKAICGYENNSMPTDLMRGDPDRNIQLAPLLLAAVIDIFLWPYLAVLFERYLYDTGVLFQSQIQGSSTKTPPENAITIRGLTKIYSTSAFHSKGDVTAVSNLDLDIPQKGIFVMLGSNGAGKSTSLSIMAGLSSITSGTVTFAGGQSRPPRGVLGIVPQKNVLFPDLTCLQTLKVWRAVKYTRKSHHDEEDLEQLLRDCDLGKKVHANAETLSGGQKRKLQLAIGLLGGSSVVLVDECTSGVDPLSRRALWKTLTAFKDDRCIVFTTHFLDEADLLGDHIAILAAPGKVVASGSPVALKREFGEGYSVQVFFGDSKDADQLYNYSSSSFQLLHAVRQIAPHAYVTNPSPSISVYHLRTKNNDCVGSVLHLMEGEMHKQLLKSYDILGTTIEDIFLKVMTENDVNSKGATWNTRHSPSSSADSLSMMHAPAPMMDLPNGKPVSPFRQAFTIFHKRVLISRRSWTAPLLAIIIAITGATVPLTFISGQQQVCVPKATDMTAFPLFLPLSPLGSVNQTAGSYPRMAVSPPGLLSDLAPLTNDLLVTNAPDEGALMSDIRESPSTYNLGGVSLDRDSGQAMIAWEGTPPGTRAPAMLNMASNLLYDRALNISSGGTSSSAPPSLIISGYATFAKVSAGTLMYIRWVFFFGAVMGVYPAFFSLYVAKERRSSIQAMQLSNGLTNPIGLWLGHLMFDMTISVFLSTVIIIIFATASDQFHGLGFLWIVFVLYGVSASLFSYVISLMVKSPLAAFALAAGYQFVMFVIYISSYLLVFTFAKISDSDHLITLIHFATSFLSPVDSVMRSALVSINLFSLLCEGTDIVSQRSLLSLKHFGGPILYLILSSMFYLAFLVWVDSGSRYPRPLKRRQLPAATSLMEGMDASRGEWNEEPIKLEKVTEKDLLRLVNISKSFHGKQVTDDVNLSIPRDSIFALLGPNGAGKTTTFNIIRGDIVPDTGDVYINDASIVCNPRQARLSLGVCPQFTAIDDQLTVREHLFIYGRLKGLDRGPQLDSSIIAILEGTSLTQYADRLASNLSGGNQRKLALGIALLGNPPVVLIDEFSTGVDPRMKRDMWKTLRRIAVGKAIVITTHSMEEASALATNVGILAKRILALGTIPQLSERYATYEVHFTCRTRDAQIKALSLMSKIPGSRKADDVATRFEVPISSGDTQYSLADLFTTLSTNGDFMDYTVERASLESIFLKVVKENNVREEGQ